LSIKKWSQTYPFTYVRPSMHARGPLPRDSPAASLESPLERSDRGELEDENKTPKESAFGLRANRSKVSLTRSPAFPPRFLMLAATVVKAIRVFAPASVTEP
jgi:hypothetical protein